MCADCFCHFFYGGYYGVSWMNAGKWQKMAKTMAKSCKKLQKELERRIPVEHLSADPGN